MILIITFLARLKGLTHFKDSIGVMIKERQYYSELTISKVMIAWKQVLNCGYPVKCWLVAIR